MGPTSCGESADGCAPTCSPSTASTPPVISARSTPTATSSSSSRRDDMVKVKGASVYPSEVESAVRTIPGVRRVFVVDLPTDDAVELGAAVVLVAGADAHRGRPRARSPDAAQRVQGADPVGHHRCRRRADDGDRKARQGAPPKHLSGRGIESPAMSDTASLRIPVGRRRRHPARRFGVALHARPREDPQRARRRDDDRVGRCGRSARAKTNASA